MVTIDNRKLYLMRLELDNDAEFIIHLNCQIFAYIQTKRKESEKMGTWDSENMWYKPNQRFHKWFQIKNINPAKHIINKDGTNDANYCKKVFTRIYRIHHNFHSERVIA